MSVIMITVQAFTPTQLIPPVPTQAFTHVVTMQVQDVTQAQSVSVQSTRGLGRDLKQTTTVVLVRSE
jgi:hypothetical protein